MLMDFQLKELIEELATGKKKEEDLVIRPIHHQYMAYFKTRPYQKALGKTELEAIENLQQFYAHVK